jgi:hypothetical protein
VTGAEQSIGQGRDMHLGATEIVAASYDHNDFHRATPVPAMLASTVCGCVVQ